MSPTQRTHSPMRLQTHDTGACAIARISAVLLTACAQAPGGEAAWMDTRAANMTAFCDPILHDLKVARLSDI